MRRLIYFDHAATSYPKPRCVIKSMTDAMVHYGGNPGRSSHTMSSEAAKAVYNCREKVCHLLGTQNPERVVFTQNSTHALNLAIHGTAKIGGHIITSNLEHNSVLRPLEALSDGAFDMSYSVFDATVDTAQELIIAFEDEINEHPETTSVVVTLASNTCGRILPVEEFAKICRRKGIILIVDASQAMGEFNVDFDKLGCHILCAPGHKGLLGPCGTGFMVLSEDFCTECESKNTSFTLPLPLMQGGNGVNSKLLTMPDDLPERFEAGTLNTPGLCGLASAIDFVMNTGLDYIREKNEYYSKMLVDGLSQIHGVTVYFANDELAHVPVVLFNIEGMSAESVAYELDKMGICVRSGLHCAPLAHNAFGTGDSGAVRASLGYGNSLSQIERFLVSVNKLANNAYSLQE